MLKKRIVPKKNKTTNFNGKTGIFIFENSKNNEKLNKIITNFYLCS